MKALVAVTCAAILAVILYFFWGEYRTAQAIAERNRLEAIEQEKAAAEIKAVNERIQAMNREAWSRECRNHANDLRAYNTFKQPRNVLPEADLVAAIKSCIEQGKLTKSELADVAHRL